MIPLMKHTFYREVETKRALSDFVLRADVLSMAGECRTLEQAFAAKQGRRFAVFVSSGSAANLILVQALLNLGRLRRGDAVGVSALTWATNVMPLLQLGLEPVVLDCALDTLNVSPAILRPVLGRLRAVFLTNVLGLCDDIRQLGDLSTAADVLLLEDNCESLGSRAYGRLLGNFGLAATFSFFVGHHLSTIEGGMVVTDDETLHDALCMARAHGWDRQITAAHQERLRAEHQVDEFLARYTFYDLAYNVRPTEIAGFLGNVQLPYWDEIVARRAEHFARFHARVRSNPDLLPLRVEHLDLVSNFAMPVVARSAALAQVYRARFEAAAVEIRPLIAGDISRQPFFRKHVGTTATSPHASQLQQQAFYFPNRPDLTAAEVTLLADLLDTPVA